MSTLKGALSGVVGPIIDKRLEGKLFLLTTVPIEENVRNLLTMGFWGVAEQLEEDGLLADLVRINCFVTQYGDVSIKLDDNQEGCHMALAIYPVQKWRNLQRTELQMLTCIVEELCHHYWNIEDEVRVNYKVLDIIKRILPNSNIQMSDLYNLQWMQEQNNSSQ